MQKKNRKLGKRITALAMSIVLLATSMPFMIANAAGDYNPVPTWPAEKADRGVSAYTNDNDGITVSFPQATANTTYRPDKKVVGYLLELIDLGAYDTVHTETAVLNKFVTPTGSAPYSAEITETEITAKLPNGLDIDHRYNITITAVGSDGWFSDELHTIVSNVPKFEYDAEMYSPIAEYDHAMREMMTFEGANGSNAAEGVVNGGVLQVLGQAEQAGVEDPHSATDKDSYGMRLRITGVPSQQQTFDTAWSRQTWDFSQAEEVWFWLDLTQVDLQGVSFRLRANEKWWDHWASGTVDNKYTVDGRSDVMGATIFSTAGYTGTDAYVYMQRADGGWQKQVLNSDGTLDIADFKGYVRIPLRFFCSEADSIVNATNENITAGGLPKTEAQANSYKLGRDVVIDPAGTCVTDALLLQNLCYSFTSGIFGSNTNHFPVGTMLAAGISTPTASDSRRATLNADGTVNNRANAYKAIEDLYSAGIAFTGCSADSVDKTLFLDNVLFYKPNDNPYPPNTVGTNTASTGFPVAQYFDQTQEIPRAIFTACRTYFTDPNWSDYRAVAYIENLIAGYKKAYGDAGVDTAFLEEANLATEAAALDMTPAWNWFLEARERCSEADTYAKDNNEPDDLVPMLEQELEKLPDPTAMISMSSEMQAAIERMHMIYGKLNLGQLDSLGVEAEARLIAYFTYLKYTLQNNSVPVGQVLTDNPFIPFADFESETVGSRAWQVANDTQNYNRVPYDYRYLKSFSTYVPHDFQDFAGYSSDTATNSLTSADPWIDGFQGAVMPTGSWGYITDDGFQGSHGATMTVDNQSYVSGQGRYNIMNFSYMGANSATFDEQRTHNMGQVRLGDLAKSFTASDDSIPLCLVMYVDLSNYSDARMAFAITTYYGGKPDAFTMDMGNNSADRKFFMLDPVSGNWVKANNSDSQYALTSTGGADRDGDGTVDLSLRNYKGFIMVPLYHFKKGGSITNRGTKLDETAEALNTIWSVSVGVAPGSDAGAVQMDSRSYTVDDIGFSYDPTFYADVAATRRSNGVTDKNFDEIFKAKSLPAYEFEQAVNDIDPYIGRNAGDTTFAAAVAAARNMYNILNAYQKEQDSVKKAESLLQTYESWVADRSLIPTPLVPYSDIAAAIDALPAAAKTATVTDANDLPYPGLVYDSATKTYAPNYAAFGFTKETCQQVISLYQDSYKLYTSTEKGAIANKDQFLKAYNAAMRCDNINKMLTEIKAYVTDISNLYVNLQEDPVAGDGSKVNFVSTDTTNLEKLKTLDARYNAMDYFAKVLLQDGSYGAQFSKAALAVKRVAKNAQSYALTDGSVLQGGIPTTVARYAQLVADTSAALEARRTFTDAEFQEMSTMVQGYLHMVPAFYNVYEMNEQIAKLLALFDVHAVSLTSEKIALTEDSLQAASTYKVEYSERSPEVPAETLANAPYKIAISSANGKMLGGASELEYNLDITVNGTVKKYKASDLVSGLPAADADLFRVENNKYTPDAPLAVEVRAYLDAAPTGAAGVLADTLTLTLVTEDGNPVSDKSGNPIQKTIQVTYAGDDAYTVTYPAEVPVSWNDSGEKDVSYSVTGSLQPGAQLAVSVTNDGTGKLNASGTDATLSYTATNFGTPEIFSGTCTDAQPANKPTVVVSGWESAPVGSYRTTLTYTVEYTPAP